MSGGYNMSRSRSGSKNRQKSTKNGWKKYQRAITKEELKEIYKQARWTANRQYSKFLKDRRKRDDINGNVQDNTENP